MASTASGVADIPGEAYAPAEITRSPAASRSPTVIFRSWARICFASPSAIGERQVLPLQTSSIVQAEIISG